MVLKKEIQMRIDTMFLGLLTAVVIGLTNFAGNAHGADRFELTSNLKPGQSIPADYYANVFGCSAKNTSPALEWKNAPEGTKSFAILVHDESAPTEAGFWHYVLLNIPADVHKIGMDDLSQGKIPQGSVEMMTDAGKPGYFGPCPPDLYFSHIRPFR
jgi:Raf kinase inhibitor-like YbhB/YbcL family protein